MTEAKTSADAAHIAQLPAQDAGRDPAIRERLETDPTDCDAQLDAALDQSMDASDPAAPVQPGDTGEPLPSSGFDPDAERNLHTR